MKPLVLGDVSISRVVEREGPHLPIADLFVDSDVSALAEHRNWLEPHFITPDNRVIHSFHCYVVRTKHFTALVDTCIGNHKHRPDYPNFHMRNGPFLKDLERLGVSRESVDIVMCTHLHVDHVGWNTMLEDGRWVPTFPNAKYLFGKKELAFWQNEIRNRGAHHTDDSIADSVIPILEAGAAVVVDEDHSIDDQVWLTPAPGHTPGQFCVHFRSGGSRAIMTGDIFHNPLQIARPDWNSIYCVDAAPAVATRRRLLERYCETGATILPAHFAYPPSGRIERSGNTFRYDVAGGSARP